MLCLFFSAHRKKTHGAFPCAKKKKEGFFFQGSKKKQVGKNHVQPFYHPLSSYAPSSKNHVEPLKPSVFFKRMVEQYAPLLPYLLKSGILKAFKRPLQKKKAPRVGPCMLCYLSLLRIG